MIRWFEQWADGFDPDHHVPALPESAISQALRGKRQFSEAEPPTRQTGATQLDVSSTEASNRNSVGATERRSWLDLSSGPEDVCYVDPPPDLSPDI